MWISVPTCEHDDGSGHSRVLDPFNGAGTTGLVALRLGRAYVGVDPSEQYLEQSRERIAQALDIEQDAIRMLMHAPRAATGASAET